MKDDAKEKLPDIRKSAKFNAPIQKVWDAIATSEGLASWLLPNDFEPRLEKDFTLQSPFGPVPCRVAEINPPNRLSFSWDEFGWLVTFELRETQEGTELTLTHAGWGAPEEIIPRAGQTNAAIHDVMNNGWEPNINEKLRTVVEG